MGVCVRTGRKLIRGECQMCNFPDKIFRCTKIGERKATKKESEMIEKRDRGKYEIESEKEVKNYEGKRNIR